MSRLRLAAATSLLTLAMCAQGCGSPEMCTLIGGTNGVHVEIPESLFVPTGRVVIDVCDGKGCESASQTLARLPENAPSPVGRGALATFDDLGRTFEPGDVTVTASLYGPRGALVAERNETIKLRRYYPNGKRCDGDGYVSGGFALRTIDLRS